MHRLIITISYFKIKLISITVVVLITRRLSGFVTNMLRYAAFN